MPTIQRLVIFVFCVMIAHAIPPQINYQGALTNPDSGAPLDTIVQISFSLYDSPDVGAVALWTHAYSNVQVTDGLFHILLGSANEPLPDLFAGDRWLGIAVGQDAEMTPRQKIVSVAHAYRVGTVDGASGGTISGELITDTLYADCLEFADATMQTTAWDSTDLAKRNWVQSMGYLRGAHNIAQPGAFVGGGDYNFARGGGCVIGGGAGTELDSNSAIGSQCFIGGGGYNFVSSEQSVVAGGMQNRATGNRAAVGGGATNWATNNCAVIAGGHNNHATESYTAIGGGSGNNAMAWGTTIGGGYVNSATDWYATVGGGYYNSANGFAATTPGGFECVAAGRYSFASGRMARAYADGSFVWADTTQTDFSSYSPNQFLIRAGGGVGIGITTPSEQLDVAGDVKGDTVIADFGFKFPDGTLQLTAAGPAGQQFADTSTWDATRSWVSSQGYLSSALQWSDTSSELATRYDLSLKADSTDHASRSWVQSQGYTVNAQSYPDTSTWDATRTWVQSMGYLRGASNNAVWNGFVGGGDNHVAGGQYSTVGGGRMNRARGDFSVIAGGGGGAWVDSNSVTGTYSAVGGGRRHSVAGVASVVSGGTSNSVSGYTSNIGGGEQNSNGGAYSGILGGHSNTIAADADYSTIAGGMQNQISGSRSFAAGWLAQANHDGAFVWADGTGSSFATTAPHQFLIRAMNGVGIGRNNPMEQLDVNGDVKADTFRANVGIRFPDGTFQATAPIAFSGQQFADTNTWDATRTWVQNQSYARSWELNPLQADTDTSEWDATKTWVQSMGYLRGAGNTVSPTGFVGGGSNNSANFNFATVGGGTNNAADGDYATVAGGIDNASGPRSAVGGGQHNKARGQYSVIAGGGGGLSADSNSVSGNYSAIGGGSRNTIGNTEYAAIAGGHNNLATAFGSSIAGGVFNRTHGSYAFVGGGGGIDPADSNSASGNYSVIGGGARNYASGHNATIPGGYANTASGMLATTSGGSLNIASLDGATVGGGTNNRARGMYSTVGGGGNATPVDSNSATGNHSTITGGGRNVASGVCATVSGFGNTASGDAAVVGGGYWNAANNYCATVAGGYQNAASVHYSTVGGGMGNLASGQVSTVSGGSGNISSATHSTVPGGYANFATGNNTFAAGYRARANHVGSFVWASTNSTDEPDSTASYGNYTFVARTPGGARFYTAHTGTATGVSLTTGGGAWNNLCDVRQKRLHGDVNTSDVLQKVASLPLHRWSYKTQDESIQHIGPTAQDFYTAFGLGESDTTINTLDPDGVALAAIQALYKEVIELRARVQTLEAAEQKATKEEK